MTRAMFGEAPNNQAINDTEPGALSRVAPGRIGDCMTRLTFVFPAIILYCMVALNADSASAFAVNQNTRDWERYTSAGEAFSVLLPKPPWVVSLPRPPRMSSTPPAGRLYAAYDDGTGYVMLSFDNADHQEDLEVFISEFEQYGVFSAGATFERDLSLNGYKGKQYRVKSSAADIAGIVQFYRTKNRVYIFEAVGDARSQPAIERFLKSVTLDMKAKAAKDIARLQASREAAAKSAAPPSPDEAKKQPTAPQEQIFSPRTVTRKAIIVARSSPEYTESARENAVTGTVVLRAVFSSSGDVTAIRAVSGLPYALTERAIAAARRIIFIPASKDGRFVSQHIQIEYNFNLY